MKMKYYLKLIVALSISLITLNVTGSEVVCFQNNRFYYPDDLEPQQVFGIKISDANTVELNALAFSLGATSIPEHIGSVHLYYTGSEEEFEFSSTKNMISSTTLANDLIEFENIDFQLAAGTSYLWLVYSLEGGEFRDTLDAVLQSITLNNSIVTDVTGADPQPVTILAVPAEDRVVAYHRIERIVTWPERFKPGVYDYVTDINIAFIQPNSSSSGIESNANLPAAITALKELIGNRKVNLHLSMNNAQRIDAMVIDPAKRVSFIDELLTMILDNGLNGFDIDREGPWTQNETSLKNGMAAFIKELREAFTPYNLYVTGASHVSYYPYSDPFIKYLDLVYTMTYDDAGAHSTMNALISGLNTVTNRMTKKFRVAGGVPFYSHQTKSGRDWNAALGFNNIVSFSDGNDETGKYFVDDNYFTYQGNEHFYNCYNTLKEKAAYIRGNHYGGIMIWATDMDMDPGTDHSPWKPLILSIGEVYGKNMYTYPGKPLCEFAASKSMIEVGGSVQFTDLSNNEPTAWAWSFPGGSPSSSTEQNPIINYNTEGSYKVELIVTNDAGSHREIKHGYIIAGEESGIDPVIAKSDWTLNYVDSEETSGEDGAAINAFDGNLSTIWHTEWSLASPDYPHEIQVDLGVMYSITGFGYTARQDGIENGMIAASEIYVSIDGINWGEAVANGTWSKKISEQIFQFTATQGQYIKLIGLNEVNGNIWASAAEINVYGTLFTNIEAAGSPISENLSVMIYPNPVKKGEFTIEVGQVNNDIRCEIFSIRGQSVYSEITQANKFVISEELNSGLYAVIVRSGKESVTKYLIVE